MEATGISYVAIAQNNKAPKGALIKIYYRESLIRNAPVR